MIECIRISMGHGKSVNKHSVVRDGRAKRRPTPSGSPRRIAVYEGEKHHILLETCES